MRGVLERMSAGAACGILDCASSREIRARTQRGYELRGALYQRTSMRHYASSPRKEKIGFEKSEERDYKGLERAQVAIPVWPAHQPRRSPGETSVRGPIVA